MTHRILTAADTGVIATAAADLDSEHKLAYFPIPTGGGDPGQVNGVDYYILSERLLSDAVYAPIHAALGAIPHRILFDTTMADDQVPDDVWYSVGRPDVDGVPIADRITRVVAASSPALADPRAPGTATMRMELRDGDRLDSLGVYPSSRVECYDRHPLFASNVGQAKWPDPPGSERYYMIKVYLPADFVIGSSEDWRVISQWKGFYGGSPPVALEIAGSDWVLGSSVASRVTLAPIALGAWTNFVVKIVHSADPVVGRLAVWQNGAVVLADHARQTMGTTSAIVQNGTDPSYWKIGNYRSVGITWIDVIHHGPSKMCYRIEAAEDAGYME